MEYTENNRRDLVRLYADKGIPGAKIKRRGEFQQIISDAEGLGIEAVLLAANMTSMSNGNGGAAGASQVRDGKPERLCICPKAE